MEDKINGRTPEEIKHGLEWAAFECDDQFCDDCKFAQDCHSFLSYEIAQYGLALIKHMEATLDRLGDFGKLFADYTGCPRGATGRAALPIEEEVLAMKPIRDVDNGEWIPVNADALRELVAKYKQLRDAVPKWISVKKVLPVKHLRVLVMNGHGMVTSGHLTYRKSKDGAPLWDMEGIKRNDVTHWAPMPEYLKGCGGI